MRVATWTGALFLGLVIFAACGGAGGEGGDAGRTGEPKDAPSVAASCQPISQAQSYRYAISLKLQSPAFQESNGGTPDDPLSAFAEALTALFADMELEGAYVAPDRYQTILRFQAEEVELRSIGDRSWLRRGATWQEQDSPPEADTLLTPQTACEEIIKDLASSLRGVEAHLETVNGVEAEHYRLDEADLKRLPEFLGPGPASALPERFGVDLWLAREGRWPMRLRIEASDINEEGQPIGLYLFMEFQDINDPTIEIEPPPVSPLGT